MTNKSVYVGEIEAGRGGGGWNWTAEGETGLFVSTEACMGVAKGFGASKADEEVVEDGRGTHRLWRTMTGEPRSREIESGARRSALS